MVKLRSGRGALRRCLRAIAAAATLLIAASLAGHLLSLYGAEMGELRSFLNGGRAGSYQPQLFLAAIVCAVSTILLGLRYGRERELEEHLHDSDARRAQQAAVLEAMLAHLGEGVVMVAPTGAIPVVNRRALDLLGLTGIPLRSIAELAAGLRDTSGQAGPKFEPDIGRILCSAAPGAATAVHVCRRGELTLEIRTASVAGGSLVHTLTDISELVRARETSQAANHSKSAFLATMSHEIRTPLNGVVGTASLLLETDLSDEQREHVETIHECSDTLLELISDILDFSKLEAGRISLEASEFDLVDVTETVLDIVEPRARAKDLLVVFAPSRQLPARVIGDPGRLRQVLLNLLSNAIKFTERGSVVVRAVPRAGNADATIRFEVEDTGIGMAESAKDRLFQEFSQLETSVSRRYGGSGLGLAICKQIVTMMGGRIGFESRLAEGSVFWFELPLKAATRAAAADAPPQAAGLNRHALVVAPCPVGREAARALLAGHGFEVVASDAPEAEAADLAMLHASVLPHAPTWRRKDHGSSWLAFGFGASRCRGKVEAVLDGALKPSSLAEALAELFPRAKAQPPPQRHTLERKAPSRRLRVLLVEDNHINQRVAARMLKNIGHDVDLAADGFEAVAQAQARAYDVILMDMQMPRMDGLEATRIIRALPGTAAQVPIVAMTANAFTSDRDACFAAGMDDFVAKPVTRDKLFNVLEHWGSNKERPAPMPKRAPAAAAASVVDHEQMAALREELGGEVLDQMLRSFCASTDALVTQIRTAVEAGDGTAADELTHKLKGSAATMGFAGIAQSCERLRALVRAGEPAAIAEGFAALLGCVRESHAFVAGGGATAGRAAA
jgi:signal transduction histidine kinase/CheY-like chemotaxis protein